MNPLKVLLWATTACILTLVIASCGGSDGPTGVGSDTTAPVVLSVNPSQDDTGVAPAAAIEITFNEAMTATTDSSVILLSDGSATSLSWSSPTQLVVQHSPWPAGTHVSVTLGTALTDLAGNGLAAPYLWDFWTQTASPQVLESTVAEGATNVGRNTAIGFLFSEEMNLFSLDSATTLTNNGVVPKAGLGFQWVSGEGTWVNLVFSPALDANTSYTLDIAATAQTNSGTPLGTAFQLNFVTGTETDTTPPTLVSIVPANGSVISPTTTTIVMTFDEAIDPNAF